MAACAEENTERQRTAAKGLKYEDIEFFSCYEGIFLLFFSIHQNSKLRKTLHPFLKKYHAHKKNTGPWARCFYDVKSERSD